MTCDQCFITNYHGVDKVTTDLFDINKLMSVYKQIINAEIVRESLYKSHKINVNRYCTLINTE